MTSVKRVTNNSGGVGGYTIIADPVYIYGNLYVTGNTNTTSTNDLAITNNSIILNAGLSGANAPNPLGANIIVDRGSSPNVSIQWSESLGYWQLTNDGSTFAKISTTGAGSVAAAGFTGSVQYNSANLLAASNSFTFSGGNLSVYGTNIGNGNVTATGVGQDLTLVAPNGKVYVNSVLKLSYQATAPNNVASTTQLFANTVGGGGTGLYVVNSGTGDELITKTKATVLALIFGY
jgi:hypothetical protein